MDDSDKKFHKYIAFEIANTQAMIMALTDLVKFDLIERYHYDPKKLQKMMRENITKYRATYRPAAENLQAHPDVDDTDSENN